MTCKDCIHSGLCYKENDYDNFPDRCGSFIPDKVFDERPTGEWVGINEYLKHLKEAYGEGYKVSSLYDCSIFCNKCWSMSNSKTCYCSACGAKMKQEATGNDIHKSTV